MSRSKRTSPALELAQQRLAGLRSIDPAPDFGAELTIADYQRDIDALNVRLNSYNEALSVIDKDQNDLELAESAVREKSRRILSAAEARYGPDSNEYEQVGGTRLSDRKRHRSQSESPGTPTPTSS